MVYASVLQLHFPMTTYDIGLMQRADKTTPGGRMQTGHFEKSTASGAGDAAQGRDEVSLLQSARAKVGRSILSIRRPNPEATQASLAMHLRNLPPHAD